MADDSRWYKWLTFAVFIIVGLLFPLSLFVNIIFATTIEEAVEHTFLTLTGWTIAFKAGILYWRRNVLRDIFRIHTSLLRDTKPLDGTNYFERFEKILASIHFMSWCVGMIQVAFSRPEDATLPSTSQLPYEFAERHSVYLTVSVWQMLCASGLVAWVTMEDTLSLALMNITCEHVAQLKRQLRQLGSQGDDLLFYVNIKDCCMRYEDCLAFANAIQKVLSLAFLVQFGVSGMVLCAAVYLLSIVSCGVKSCYA